MFLYGAGSVSLLSRVPRLHLVEGAEERDDETLLGLALSDPLVKMYRRLDAVPQQIVRNAWPEDVESCGIGMLMTISGVPEPYQTADAELRKDLASSVLEFSQSKRTSIQSIIGSFDLHAVRPARFLASMKVE